MAPSEVELVAEPEPEPKATVGLSAETKARAVRALAIWNFAFDQARGNFAHQADQNLALALCHGNSVRTVQMQTYVTSASAVAQFVSNQIIGQWCDTFGRKPLLVGFPVLIATLRLMVAAVPCWPTLFAAELANYMTFQVAMTPVHATLGDLYSGDDLATSMSQVQSMKGVSRIAGNPVGVWLSAMGTTHAQVGAAGAALCAAVSAATQMPETLPASKDAADAKTPRRGGGSINPLNFLQLFTKTYRLGVLTIVSALTDVAEFTFDVDNHLYISVGMDARLIGLYAMGQGVSSIVAGGVATRLIPALGPAGYTMVANCCAACSMLVRSVARTPLGVFLSLIPYTFGPMGTRSSCINSLHTAEATEAGLAMGELVAARANFFTILKMVVPLGYARLYAYGQRFPYMFAAGLIGLAQVMLLTIKGRGAPLGK
jgi:MFS family permease